MKLVTTILAVIFSLACTTLPLYAQWLPRNFNADSSFRVEYLLGSQTLGNQNGSINLTGQETYPNAPPPTITVPYPNPNELLRLNFSNSQLVLDGAVEITPRPTLSSRLRGAVSVLNPNRNMTLESGPYPVAYPNPPGPYSWAGLPAVINSQFYLWEAAGLYNLIYEGCYRYSIVGGYRQESWTYPTSSTEATNSYFKDVFVSNSPFLGMQTVMVCPTWKARFELLGSPFMSKSITHKARNQGYYMQLDGNLTTGGFLEFQVEGNINVTPCAWMGIYSQYTYESLSGNLTGISADGNGNATYVPTSYRFYTDKNTWLVGLNSNFQF